MASTFAKGPKCQEGRIGERLIKRHNHDRSLIDQFVERRDCRRSEPGE